MADPQPILLAIHTLPHQGRKLLADKWPFFLEALRKQLSMLGSELRSSTEALFLFTFDHPAGIVAMLPEILGTLKREFEWNPDALGSLPIQLVIHFDKKDEHSTALRDLSSNLWDFLRQETIYITRPLKVRWNEMMKDRELPPHQIDREGMGLFRLSFSTGDKNRVSLFPYREMAVLGKQRECFYCGMTNHTAEACPSKLLTADMQGLDDVGYLPFAELSEIYKQVMTQQDHLLSSLNEEIKPSLIRKNPALLVFVSYFDLYKIHQLRFLQKLAFGLYYKWDDIYTRASRNIDNSNLNLALDCLRVGQYDQAEKLLHDELANQRGRHFYATVGLAFWALENKRDNDLQTSLQRAQELASTETEKVYINLLITRHSLLTGDKWKAEMSLENILNLKHDCDEARYAKIKYHVRTGQGDQAAQELRILAGASKQYFMTILMDPSLLPIHTLAEDILAAHLHIVGRDAIDNLNKARVGCDELRYWLKEEDPELAENMEALNALEEQYKRKSYFDLIDVAQKSLTIHYACHQIKEKKLERLNRLLVRLQDQWDVHHTYWTNYSYKVFFREFDNSLNKVSSQIEVTQKLAERATGEAYQVAIKELEKIKSAFASLKKLIKRMIWVKLIVDSLRIFVKNILITEAALLTLLLFSFLVISAMTSTSPDSGMAKIISNSWFQKQATFFTTAIFSPFISLMMTIWEVRDQKII